MTYYYHHTLGSYEIDYTMKEDKPSFLQHINVYNPDIEIEQ